VLVQLLGANPAEQGALATARDRVEESGRRRSTQPAPVVVPTPAGLTVGRERELGVLADAVAKVGVGRGGAVFVLGEMCIGKSRLLRDAERLSVAAGAVVLRGRAARRSPRFRLLSEALYSALRRTGVPEDDPSLTPYWPALSRLVPEWTPQRTAVLGAHDSVTMLAEGVLRLCCRLARKSGCVLVLDDLQDADPDTLAVVDYLADNAAGVGVLVVGAAFAAPGAAVDVARAAGRRGVATILEPAPLDDAAVRALAAARLGVPVESLPADAMQRLVRHAGGNPFFAEELLAEMIRDGHLTRSGGRWCSADPVRSNVPAAVLARVIDQVGQLGPRGTVVLRAAAMLAQPFTAALIRAATGLPAAGVVDVLRAAVNARLVRVDRGRYVFGHTLIAASLRAEMLPEERAALLRRARPPIRATEPIPTARPSGPSDRVPAGVD
jgi:hypothetical protein